MRRPGGIHRVRRFAAGIAILIVQGSCIAPAAERSATLPAKPATKPTPTATAPLKVTAPSASAANQRLLTQTSFRLAGPMTADGRFMIAFDRDAPASATLSATLEDGRQIDEVLTVAKRAWDIERLNSLPRFAQPSEEFDRLRPAELEQINAARQISVNSAGWQQQFLWPVVGRLSGMFGSQRIYKNGEAGSYHSGSDVAQPIGTPVIAPADGVVILAADHPFTLEGNLLMIDHGMGLNSAFLHLSRIDVRVGETIKRGQRIGAVGMTGRATGPHLHWSLKWHNSRIDPLLLAGPMPVIQ